MQRLQTRFAKAFDVFKPHHVFLLSSSVKKGRG
jgi:hypothetical protein